MADPFSIVVGTVNLLDVCFRVGKYIHDVKVGTDKVNEEIEALSFQVEAIISITQSIKGVFEDDLAHATDSISKKRDGIHSLWEEVGNNVQSCQATLVKLLALLKLVVGKESPRVLSKLDGLRKFLRKQSKEAEFVMLRQQLRDYHQSLQILLTAVNIVFTRTIQSTSDRSFTQLSEDIQNLRANLECQIASLQTSNGSSLETTLYRTLTLAQEVVPLASPNLYFEVPQSARSIFTGRRSELDKVEGSLLSPMPFHQPCVQKRFVIFGLRGSGKTELCRKFSEENRHFFWGIFWIDASSDEYATQSFARIARAAKIEPATALAAKSWLANANSPWLLVIDNADSLEKPIEQYLPVGEIGSIIITTRDPALRILGMPGRHYLRFTELKEDEASDLLLRAADEPTPYSPTIYHLATGITKKLGYLPLALVHAGKATATGVCTMHDYLTAFDEHWDRVRIVRNSKSSNVEVYKDAYAIIYSTYEIMYQGLMAR